MGYQVEKIRACHQRMLDLHLVGKSNTDIAQELEVTPTTVNSFLSSHLAQHKIAQRRDKIEKIQNEAIGHSVTRARDILNEEAERSANKLAELRDTSLDENIQLKASNSILDKVFGSDAKNGGGAKTQVLIQANQVILLKQTLEEDREIAQLLLDQQLAQNPVPTEQSTDTGSEPVSLPDTSANGSNQGTGVSTAAA